MAADLCLEDVLFIAFKRGDGRIDIKFTLVVQEFTFVRTHKTPDPRSRDQTEMLPRDRYEETTRVYNTHRLSFDMQHRVTDRIRCPYFSIGVADDLESFDDFSEYVQSRINDKIEYIIKNIVLSTQQRLLEIVASGISYIYNEDEDIMDQLPLIFTYQHTVTEQGQQQYDKLSKELLEHLKQNIIYFDRYLTDVESEYVTKVRIAQLSRKSSAPQ